MEENALAKTVLDRLEKVNGVPIPTAKNFYLILKYDQFFSDVKLDTMKMAACRVSDSGERTYWEDSDDALARMYIEEHYGLRNVGKQNDAFLAVLAERKFSPIQEMIKALRWDGKPHCENFFQFALEADDSRYTREIARIHFRQMIERAFIPGCKADHVLVLKGVQGCGKSTICRWLALEDALYASVGTIDGQKGFEAVQGKFCCELEELLAVVGEGTRKEAQVKSFLSGQSDHYRRPFDRRSSDNPRTCFFVGTTNRDRFLTDPTGNRRWYPLECRRKDGAWVFKHEAEIKSEIRQSIAEMFEAWKNARPLASPMPDIAILKTIQQMQEASELEDYRVGIIEKYLKATGKPYVCCIELWENAFPDGTSKRAMTRADANELGELLRLKIGCLPIGKRYSSQYGTQHTYSVPERFIKQR